MRQPHDRDIGFTQAELVGHVKPYADVLLQPNENGLFTIDQVAVLAWKRDCSTKAVDDFGCEITRPGKLTTDPWITFKIMATDRGLWSSVAIFRACREAAGQPSYTIDYAKAKIRNPGGLDEVRIAEIVGADGVRPYLSRPSQYRTHGLDGGRMNVKRPLWGALRAELAAGYMIVNDDGMKQAEAGNWTWPMLWVMCGGPHGGSAGKSYDYRRAVRALDDAGLLKLTLGSRGGFGTATFTWLPLAYLAPIERPAPKLDPVDAEYLADLAALG